VLSVPVGLSRRSAIKALAGLGGFIVIASVPVPGFGDDSPSETGPFTFDSLSAQMKALAAKPFVAEMNALPDVIGKLTYDEYMRIRPHSRPLGMAPGTGYELQPFPLGWLQKDQVNLLEVENGSATDLSFTAADFDYGTPELAAKLANVPLPGVAGFRLDCPFNTPSQLDELVAFLGASYFRALGRGNAYGASARGAVIDSWLPPPQPEEFPRFTSFYVEPAAFPGPITLYASLEGPSVTGAFRFTFDPASASRQDTQVDVTARFFFRADIAEMGIAPLTSMYLFSDANRSAFDDYRPQVHDSDGLFMDGGSGDVAWRALNNPPSLANSYFAHKSLKSFGLMQRARNFTDYEDEGARYHQRPSILVEPKGDWGEGSVRLIEVPAKLEADDNIVAFWIPKTPFKAGDNAEFGYRLRWGDLLPDPAGPLGYVADTRTGQGGVSGVENKATLRKFVVDFAGGGLADLDPDQVDAVATATGGGSKLAVSAVSKIPETGAMRLALDVEIDSHDPVELRAYLVGGGRQLTETWLYQWRAA